MRTNTRREEIRRAQNDLLYDGVKFSAVGSVVAALVVLVIFGPVSGYGAAATWFSLVALVYGLRAVDLVAYRRHRRTDEGVEQAAKWRWRVSVGAIASSLTWCSCLWIIYPADHPAYEALLILMLGGVSGGALATLPYDRRLSNLFQVLVLASVQARLWSDAGRYDIELAVFALFVFGFLIACGKEVGNNYFDLLSLRHDSQATNLELMRTTEEMARLGYWQWPIGTERIELSEKLSTMLGVETTEVRATACYRLIHPEDRHRVRQSVEKAARFDEEVRFEYRVRPRGGEGYQHMKQVVKTVVDSSGLPILLGTMQDVSDVKEAESRIIRMAYYDELTSLENRARFHEHLEHHVRMANRVGRSLAVVYIDLDDFKSINDSFGHEHADTYLTTIAKHLAGSVRKSDYVARMGGDEFAVLIHGFDDESVIARTVERVFQVTKGAISIGPHRLQPRLSAGVAIYPADGETPDRLLSSATIALEHVKRHPELTHAEYTTEMETSRLERARLEADLRRALEKDEFELWYQPKIDVGLDRMSGVEALIRWRHPQKGMISPELFVTTAERVGMISEIGDWVLRTACRQQSEWKASGLEIKMAINISGEHFVLPGFVERVSDVVVLNGLGAGDLEIEITESLSRDPVEHKRICRDLRAVGVRIAIDDFGTGYSSLSVLGDLPIDTLKIDRSFIEGLPNGTTSRLMVDTIVALSNGLGYEMVAEGVETREQLEYLSASGCPTIQGYYFSRPVRPREIPALADVRWVYPRAA